MSFQVSLVYAKPASASSGYYHIQVVQLIVTLTDVSEFQKRSPLIYTEVLDIFGKEGEFLFVWFLFFKARFLCMIVAVLELTL